MDRGERLKNYENWPKQFKLLIAKQQRIGILVDNIDLFNAILSRPELQQKRIDYVAFKSFLAKARTVNRAIFYYDSFIPQAHDDALEESVRRRETQEVLRKRRSFLNVLEKAGGFETVASARSGRTHSAAYDIIYDLCAMSRQNNFNLLVLVGGNEAYARAIRRVRQDTGMPVEVVFFEEQCHFNVLEAASDFTNLSKPSTIDRIFVDRHLRDGHQ